MPTIAYYVAASVDGYIADADGGVGWLPEGESPEKESEDYGYYDFYAGVDALAMGRRTYDQVLGFGQWPYAGKPAYVFTSRPPQENPYGVEFVTEEPAEFVRDIAAQYDGTLWLVGGANLAEGFRRADLIDEYLIHVVPVALGRGIPLFGGDAPPTPLRLVESRSYDDGVVMLHYRRAAG